MLSSNTFHVHTYIIWSSLFRFLGKRPHDNHHTISLLSLRCFVCLTVPILFWVIITGNEAAHYTFSNDYLQIWGVNPKYFVFIFPASLNSPLIDFITYMYLHVWYYLMKSICMYVCVYKLLMSVT